MHIRMYVIMSKFQSGINVIITVVFTSHMHE